MVKIKIGYAVAITFFILVIWNEYHKSDERNELSITVKQTLDRMETFMDSGGRNTAEQGYNLCKELEAIKSEYNHEHGRPHKPKSCEEMYNINLNEQE